MVQALDDYDGQEDLPQALCLLGEMNNNVKHVSDIVESMLQRVKTGELSTEYGLSFLEMKYHMLLTYLINLTYVVLRKCSGQRISGDPAIDRLIELRTILEKIRPIDQKLRYQIDKLVKTAVTGAGSSSDPITFKANPNSLISQIPDERNGSDSEAGEGSSDDDTEASEDESKSNKVKKKSKESKAGVGGSGGGGGVYVPPKLTAVPYDEEDTKAERTRKQMERARKRALNSSIIQDLAEEYLDTPMEVSAGSRAQQMLSKSQREKQEYEEDYMTRLPVTRAEKHRQRKLTTLGTLGDEITSFGDITALEGGDLPFSGAKRKRKATPKKKSGKKRKFH